MLVDFFPTDNIFFRDFLFSFPQESSFPWRIPGSDKLNLKKSQAVQLPKQLIKFHPDELKRVQNVNDFKSGI